MKSYSREEGKGIVCYFGFVYNRCEGSLMLKKKNCFRKYISYFISVTNFQGLRCFVTAVMIIVLIKKA